MKAVVILENAPDCELDRVEFEYVDQEDVDAKVSSILDGMILSVGDTIRIVDVA